MNQPPKLPSDSYDPTTLLLWMIFFFFSLAGITGALMEKSPTPLIPPGAMLLYLLNRKH
jgi:hypothetical protein